MRLPSSKLLRTRILRDEWKALLIVTFFFTVFAFLASNTLQPHALAKVDFEMSFQNWKSVLGWSPDNFGRPSSLDRNIVFFQNLVASIPEVPYRDFFFFYLVPALLAGYSIFLWVDFYLFQRQVLEAKLVASYVVFFFFTSVIFVGIFMYGWNLLTLLPIAGLALSCHGIDKFYESKDTGSAIVIALGALLIGGMLQYFLVPIFYALSKSATKKSVLQVWAILGLSNLYILLPEIYASSVLSFQHYQGVDPAGQTKMIQNSLGLVSRMSGAMDSVIRPYWSQTVWVLISFLAFLGFRSFNKLGLETLGLRTTIYFFGALNFSGLFWSISLNRLWLQIPAVGGIFRNPEKIFYVFALFMFVMAAFWLKSHSRFRWGLVVLVLLTSSSFYLTGALRPYLHTADFQLPKSYVAYQASSEKYSVEDRVLLLPFPTWFHFYPWAGGVQTTNILKRVISPAVVSDEFNPPMNITKDLYEDIKYVYTNHRHCIQASDTARRLGITHVVLQEDLSGVVPSDIEQMRIALERCLGKPRFASEELLVFQVEESPGRISLVGASKKPTEESKVTSTFLGYKVCVPSPDELILKEKLSSFTYLNIKDSTMHSSFIDQDGWRRWALPSKGCYSLVNTNSIVTIFSIVMSMAFLLCLVIKHSLNRHQFRQP